MQVALRLCLAAIICSIGMSAAAASCTYPGQDYYNQASSATCSFASYCFNDLCTCLGLAQTTWNQTLNGRTCLSQTTATCRSRGQCLGKLFKCLILAGENHRAATACSTFGSSIHMGYLQYASSPNYTQSTLYTSCVYSACQYNTNTTTNPQACNITNAQICVCSSPEGTTPSITLVGTFPIAHSTDKYWTAIEKDLLALFGVEICVTALTVTDATKMVINLAVHNGASQAKVVVAATTTTWLTNVLALSGVAITSSSGSNIPSTTPAPTTPPVTPRPVTTAGATAGAFSFLALLALAMML